jgi:nucleoid-associated protein YgaU
MMKKTRAIWVAVIVLAVAALLMFSVVIPQLREGRLGEEIAKTANDAIEQVKQTATETGEAVKAQSGEAADALLKGAMDKVARIRTDIGTATGEMDTVMAASPAPTPEQIAAARAKLEAALKSAAALTAPDSLDTATKGLISTIAGGANQALAALRTMPADIDAARSVWASIKAQLAAALEGKASLPATAANAAKAGVATEDATAAEPAAKTADEQAASSVEKAVDSGAKPAAENALPTAAATIPTFDILRVEPDGSTVIAGRSDPAAKIDVLDADAVIASTKASEGGEFVAILEQPLPSGDHQIVLRATTKEGKTVVSEEVATVSVPKNGVGDLLAMVSKPGEASRILAMPSGKPGTEVAGDNAEIPATVGDKTANGDVETAAATKVDGTTATPALPDAFGEISATPPVVLGETDAAVDVSAKDGAAEDTAATDMATAQPGDALTPADEAKPATAPDVVVSAVEIEGDRIFVAGGARPKSIVRIYVDDKLVGEVATDENGRFVADAIMPLSIGDHRIRADVLSADGKRVEFRASVPFFRPEGQQLAAVASNTSSERPKKMQPLADGAYDKAREEAHKAVALLKGLYDSGRIPTPEELAAARSATEFALKTLSQVKLAANVDPLAIEIASRTADEAAKALNLLKSLPQDAKAVKSALASIDDAVTSAVAPSMQIETADTAANRPEPATSDIARADVEADKPAASETADTSDLAGTPDASTKSASGQTAAADVEPKTIEQAPLQASQASVIIRRGDTLWQISRRVYGKGVRYTTIYLANEDQITNPDKIMPGQVFGVPTTPLGNAEELHRKRLHVQ